MEFSQIIELINTISDSKVTSLTFEEGNQKITIKAGDNKQPQVVQMVPPTVAPVMQPLSQPIGNVVVTESDEALNKSEKTEDKNIKTVTSPLVGTFYSAPSPDAEAFVKVGDTVKKGQVVGIVEAMKLMNEIECEHDGVITEIMLNNGDMVEYGQVLIKIK